MSTSARKLLKALHSGQPISGEKGANWLAPSYKRAIAPIIKDIEKARQGSGLIKDVFWVTGKPGNGKTQTIRQLIHLLRQQSAATKFAYVHIDLDQKSAARKSETLIPTIVRSILSSGTVDGVKSVSEHIISDTPVSNSAKESLVFSIDFLSELAGIPPISLFIGFSLNRLLSFYKTREKYIKSIIAKKWGSNPELLELLTAWIRYTLKPNLERDDEFSSLLRRFSSRGELLDLFCFVLEKANYSTLVLILDEVDMVSIESLKPIWDPSLSEPYETNIIFVLSAQESVVSEVKKDKALERRFCKTEYGHIQLAGPNIQEYGEDDLQHIISCVDSLLDDVPQLRNFDVEPEDLLSILRDKHIDKSPTWQDVWRDVISELADL